ncbi:hypothetical protein GCM10009830_29920 [Glycomyces endophyticus]|uniref:Tetratricopeptide repeat protein n=1 Tax=Glycomyces endophyticus TaxID=480996 RepID=A0ABP4T1P8_9ACTN
MEPVTTALTTWVARQLAQQTAGLVKARLRRDSDAPEVRKALLLAVKGGLDVAVDEAFPGDLEQQAAVTAALLERDDDALPLIDGTGLAQLVGSVRVWIAETESPVGEHGLPERIDASHPLAAPLCAAILAQVRWDATRGTRALAALWSDFKLACLETPPGPGHLRDYWHPDTTGAGFVGRGPELDGLDAALRGGDGAGRIQVVAGFGGIGKTELAVAYARRHSSAYPDGCVFYNFQSYTDGRVPETSDQALVKILPTIRDDLTSAGVEQLSADGRVSAWQQSTAGRTLLMVWDNVKHVEQIERLLLRQEGCATIVTTRDHLDLGESAAIPLDALDRGTARALFTGIAGTGHDAATVDRLIEADLFVPVLIKAHAHLVRSGRRGLAEIAGGPGRAGGSGKRRTQQALFDRLDGSYRYLDDDLRYAFRFLGAHPGGFVLADTAAAVLGCDPDEAEAFMEDLIDAGMARRHHLTAPGMTAYSAHDVLRAYAAHRAHLEDEMAPLRSELLAHYLRRLRDRGAGDQEWLEAEIDNVADTARAGRSREHADLALHAGHVLFGFGRYTDAAAVYRHAAERYAESGEERQRGHALVGRGEVARLQGEWDRSLEYCKEAVGVFERTGDRDGLIKAAVGLGHVARLKGEHEEAARHFARAAEQAGEAGDQAVQARALVGLGHVHRLQRRWDDAVGAFERAAALDDALQRANALRGIGDVLRAQDEPARADEHYGQALGTYTALGDRNGEANAYLGRGAVSLIQRDWDEADRRYRSAGEIFIELGNRFGLGTALRGRGTAAAGARDPEAARRLLHEALAIYAALQSPAVNGLRVQIQQLETDFAVDADPADADARPSDGE